ncbi:hypothetical protein EYF80_046970 [Liparis tanakae]|uniref:Uncharacterized protein n=1 Tax=Liparis tanakae TaxID=230148 RepID=A0A4Z2FPQ2_9TELE|nr:hypothetical protein EYF80_046970 [Liparis tanakae]
MASWLRLAKAFTHDEQLKTRGFWELGDGPGCYDQMSETQPPADIRQQPDRLISPTTGLLFISSQKAASAEFSPLANDRPADRRGEARSAHCDTRLISGFTSVRGPLEGLAAQAAHVAAVLAVRLAAVAPQRVGVLAQQAAVVALVTALGLRLGDLRPLVDHVGDLEGTERNTETDSYGRKDSNERGTPEPEEPKTLRLSVTPSSIPWASASVRVTLSSPATPPGDITRLWDTAACDRAVLGGRLETEGRRGPPVTSLVNSGGGVGLHLGEGLGQAGVVDGQGDLLPTGGDQSRAADDGQAAQRVEDDAGGHRGVDGRQELAARVGDEAGVHGQGLGEEAALLQGLLEEGVVNLEERARLQMKRKERERDSLKCVTTACGYVVAFEKKCQGHSCSHI